MDPATEPQGKSELALAIEQHERKLHEFEVQGFFGLGDKPIHKIGMRVAFKETEDKALIAAHTWMKEKAGDLDEAMKDNDLLGDTKLVEILNRVCLSVDEKTKMGVPYPAFPSPQWMKANMTTDQLAVLINLYHEVRKIEGPMLWDIGLDKVREIASVCHEHRDGPIPEQYLAPCSREWLTSAFVLLSTQWTNAIDKLKEHGLAGEDQLGSDEQDAPPSDSEIVVDGAEDAAGSAEGD